MTSAAHGIMVIKLSKQAIVSEFNSHKVSHTSKLSLTNNNWHFTTFPSIYAGIKV